MLNLVKLFKAKYASLTIMLVKNYIFDNWIEHHMCKDVWIGMNK